MNNFLSHDYSLGNVEHVCTFTAILSFILNVQTLAVIPVSQIQTYAINWFMSMLVVFIN